MFSNDVGNPVALPQSKVVISPAQTSYKPLAVTPYVINPNLTPDGLSAYIAAPTVAIANHSLYTPLTTVDGLAEPFSTRSLRQNVQFLITNRAEKPPKKIPDESLMKTCVSPEKITSNPDILFSEAYEKRSNNGAQRVLAHLGNQNVNDMNAPSYNDSLEDNIQNVYNVAQTSNKKYSNDDLANMTVEESQTRSDPEIEESITSIQRGVSEMYIHSLPKRQIVNNSARCSRPRKHHRKNSQSCISCGTMSKRMHLPLRYAKHTLETVYEGSIEDPERQEEANGNTNEQKICDMYLWCGYCLFGNHCLYADTHDSNKFRDWPFDV
ncbi:unnamed protein product [Enterobius vermicularis]|uniref:C3H1-type domain-containing protein n=1 Tax=Enterobius vermicularis TaxID=51028 RepID=A0A0N4VDE7_ENTVE|nr:unnamed protein product [Enterobius vermicularis]